MQPLQITPRLGPTASLVKKNADILPRIDLEAIVSAATAEMHRRDYPCEASWKKAQRA